MTDKRTDKLAEYLVFAECNHALIGCVCRSKDVWGVFWALHSMVQPGELQTTTFITNNYCTITWKTNNTHNNPFQTYSTPQRFACKCSINEHCWPARQSCVLLFCEWMKESHRIHSSITETNYDQELSRSMSLFRLRLSFTLQRAAIHYSICLKWQTKMTAICNSNVGFVSDRSILMPANCQGWGCFNVTLCSLHWEDEAITSLVSTYATLKSAFV